MNRHEALKGFFTFLVLVLVISSIAISLKYIKGPKSLNSLLKASEERNGPLNVKVNNISYSSVEISWLTKTIEKGTITYGTSPILCDLNEMECSKINETEEKTSHVLKLSGLQPNTTYYYKIGTTVESFRTAEKVDVTNTTVSNDTSKLTLEGIQKAMNNFDSRYDLNKDGVINSMDYILLQKSISQNTNNN